MLANSDHCSYPSVPRKLSQNQKWSSKQKNKNKKLKTKKQKIPFETQK
jgi:hypothetical protein